MREIFEQHSCHLQDLFKFNPRMCNSASLFSGCVHRGKSKCCIALPTDTEHVTVFEKTLINGFSWVNTRLAFDTKILLENKKKMKKGYLIYTSTVKNKQVLRNLCRTFVLRKKNIPQLLQNLIGS